jgi:F-type H+-transporting ATPase subunit b
MDMPFLHEAEFWVGVSSVLTFAFIISKAWKPIIESLDRRSAVISSRLDEAENLFLEAEKLLADYQARQQNAQAEADAILQAAKRRADSIVAQAEADMQKAITHQENAARLRIQRAEQDVIEAIREAIVKAALNRVQAQLEQTGTQTETIDASLNAVSKSFH